MGQARERERALRRGQPLPQDRRRCPYCFSFHTVISTMPAELAMSHVATPVGICGDCKTFWEAFPDDWTHDVVEATPCDNCAFAKGSPESEDRDGWRALLANLRNGQEFKCHKGAPILFRPGTEEQIGFDEAWIRAKGRTCAGFLRAMQQWPDWLERRYPGLAVRKTDPQSAAHTIPQPPEGNPQP